MKSESTSDQPSKTTISHSVRLDESCNPETTATNSRVRNTPKAKFYGPFSDEDFYEASSERRKLIKTFADITGTGRVRKEFWAILQLCSIERLERFVVDAVATEVDLRRAMRKYLEKIACALVVAWGDSSGFRRNTGECQPNDEAMKDPVYRDAMLREYGNDATQTEASKGYSPIVTRILPYELCIASQSNVVGGARHDLWLGLTTFWGYEWCRAAHDLVGAQDPWNYTATGRDPLSNNMALSGLYFGTFAFSTRAFKPVLTEDGQSISLWEFELPELWRDDIMIDITERPISARLNNTHYGVPPREIVRFENKSSKGLELPSYDLLKIPWMLQRLEDLCDCKYLKYGGTYPTSD